MSLTNIVNDISNKAKASAFAVGLAALAIASQKADAGVVVETKIYEHGTQNQATSILAGQDYDVRGFFDTTALDVNSKSFKFIQWQLVLPSGISVSAASPSSSTTFLTNDYFTGSTMESNGLLTKVNTDFTNINYRTAKLDFPSDRDAPIFEYLFQADSSLTGQMISFDFYKSDTGTYTNLIAGDTSGTNYKQLSGNLSVVNQSFEVTPEPMTLGLLTVGLSALTASYIRNRRKEQKEEL
jgi:hypothetical protein